LNIKWTSFTNYIWVI